MRPRHAVPATKFVILHNPGPEGDQAADIFANAGSIVLAPLDGEVANVMNIEATSGGKLQGWQIRGYLRLPGEPRKLLPFVAAHLQPRSFPPQGARFTKGQVIGKIERWDTHPESTHVHMAFRQPAAVGAQRPQMPPPANIPVLRAFELCGPAPGRSMRGGPVPEARGKPLHDDLEDI